MKILKIEDSPSIVISTWQSIVKQPPAWFSQFDVAIGDEAHQFKAKSMTSIMEKMTSTKYRVGTTGSLDNKKINKLVLEGVFGPVHKVTSTKKLQQQGKLAELHITSLLLKYDDQSRQDCKKMEYRDEVDYIVSHTGRNKFITNLALSTKGNTLLLFQFVERHGQVLFDLIREKAKGRNVYFIHGKVDVLERERIRKALAEETDAIVVASYGTMSTGINIPSIENMIFSSPSKSIIRVLQSVGRGLRLNVGKDGCKLYDLTDDLSWKAWKNHTLKHGAERYKIYAAEQFNIKLAAVSIMGKAK